MNSRALDFDLITSSLTKNGYVVISEALAKETIDGLLNFAKRQFEENLFTTTAIGHQDTKHQDRTTRGDLSLWLDDAPPCAEVDTFLEQISAIIEVAKSEWYLPAKRFEGHFAVYPKGSRYTPHLDCHKFTSHRLLSVILYLSSLAEDQGGELKLHNTLNEQNTNLMIRPTAGTMVIFLSDKIVHEVLTTHQERWSLTGWIRDDLL